MEEELTPLAAENRAIASDTFEVALAHATLRWEAEVENAKFDPLDGPRDPTRGFARLGTRQTGGLRTGGSNVVALEQPVAGVWIASARSSPRSAYCLGSVSFD